MPTSAPPKPPLSRAYTLKASKIPNYFEVLLENPEPEVFDTAVLAKSGFRYAIDRTFIDILKGLGFLNEAGQPTRRYRDFRDHRQAAAALRLGLTEAYAGLLAALPDAAVCSEREIMEAVSQYFEGELNDMAVGGIAATYLALTRYAASLDNGAASADAAAIVGAVQRSATATLAAFEPPSASPDARGLSAAAVAEPAAEPAANPEPVADPEPVATASPALDATPLAGPEPGAAPKTTNKTEGAPGIVIEACPPEACNQTQGTSQRAIIHITLPASTDEAVYDAIFASLKRHLLSPGDSA
ncbi:DUF5343 domain-containing protein [Solidesulfovibrio carbinolicus]|nr:DUF5343 domain-containing protein [Solidesulfovibrio carbinolicus]